MDIVIHLEWQNSLFNNNSYHYSCVMNIKNSITPTPTPTALPTLFTTYIHYVFVLISALCLTHIF